MMFELLKGNDPLLKQTCPEFNFERGYFIEQGLAFNGEYLYNYLRDKMIEHKGVGLSAPQLGIMTRAFVIGNPSDPDNIIGVFNPMIVDYSEETVVYEEGCVSYPGIFLKIKRPRSVRVRYRNWEGEANTIRFDGYTARVFQHEYDHLNGITFHSRASRYHLEQARRFKDRADRKLKSA
jgi:peptide deformylase